MDEKKQQEIMYKFQMFEQQMQQLQQQLQAVEQAIVDMNTLNFGLDELVGKEGEEIMALIGRGIFARAKLLSEELLVDIGDKNVIKKSIPDTKKLIGSQIEKLEDVKKDLNDNMEQVNSELMKMYYEAQENAGHTHSHSCGCEEKCDDCECEE